MPSALHNYCYLHTPHASMWTSMINTLNDQAIQLDILYCYDCCIKV